MKKLHASCLCQAVTLHIDDNFSYAGYCHCNECQKLSGAPFIAFGGIQKTDVQVLSGKKHIRYFDLGAQNMTLLLAYIHAAGK